MSRYPGWALVTGASSGIGAAFARALSAEGAPVALVARRRDRLEALAAELPGESLVIEADLSTREGRDRAVEALGDRPVGLLVHSAGFGIFGHLDQLDRDRDLEMIEVNVVAGVDLFHRFVPGMLARGGGGVIAVSSISAFTGSPYMGSYSGTKAFLLSFCESMAAELGPRGLDVVCLCPGPTRTGFKDVARVDADPSESMWARPEDVAALGLRSLGRSQIAVHGASNRLGVWLTRLLPRAWTTRLAGQVMWKMSARLKREAPGS